MPSLATMRARIANELARADLSAEIGDAIASAIGFYEGQRFWFNEGHGTFSTVAGQEAYTVTDWPALAEVRTFDSVRAFVSNRWLPLIRRTWEELLYLSSGLALNADPTDYAYYAQQLRLYPVPTEVRTIEVFYVRTLGVPADDSASNAWTTEAEELIRTHAKVDLLENVIRSDESVGEAVRLRAREAAVFLRLSSVTRNLVTSDGIQAHYL